jgi:hypothetical protein
MFTFIDPKKAPIGTVLISLISLREGWLTATASRTVSDGMPVPGCTSSSLALIRQAAIAAGLAQ